MDKTTDKFCPECGHHLYTFCIINPARFFCIECSQWLEPEQVATMHEVETLRREFMSQGEE